MVKVRTVVEEPELVKASNEFEAEMAKGETIAFCQSMADKARQNGDMSEAEVWGFMQVIFGEFVVARGPAVLLLYGATHECRNGSVSSRSTEANARQQLLEHLGFHADTIEKAALEFNEDIVKGVENMSVEEKSTAPMVSARQDRFSCMIGYQD